MQKKLRNNGPAVAWTAVFVVLALMPLMLQSGFYLRILTLALVAVIVAVGVDIVLGMTGQLSICQGAFFGLGSYTAALLMVKADWPWLSASVAGIGIAVVAGYLLGLISLRLRGHYLAIVTLGFTVVVQQVLVNWVEVTGGPLGLTGIPRPAALVVGGFSLNWKNSQNYYYLVFAAAALAVYLAYRIKVSKLGSILRCIREDEIAASHIGIDITRYKVLSFTLSACFAGAAGGLYSSLVGILAPDLFGVPQSANYLIMATIGGLGSVTGVAISTVGLTLLPELLREAKQWREIIYGGLLLITVIFFPKGLAGSAYVLASVFRQSGNRSLAKALEGGRVGAEARRNQ